MLNSILTAISQEQSFIPANPAAAAYLYSGGQSQGLNIGGFGSYSGTGLDSGSRYSFGKFLGDSINSANGEASTQGQGAGGEEKAAASTPAQTPSSANNDSAGTNSGPSSSADNSKNASNGSLNSSGGNNHHNASDAVSGQGKTSDKNDGGNSKAPGGPNQARANVQASFSPVQNTVIPNIYLANANLPDTGKNTANQPESQNANRQNSETANPQTSNVNPGVSGKENGDGNNSGNSGGGANAGDIALRLASSSASTPDISEQTNGNGNNNSVSGSSGNTGNTGNAANINQSGNSSSSAAAINNSSSAVSSNGQNQTSQAAASSTSSSSPFYSSILSGIVSGRESAGKNEGPARTQEKASASRDTQKTGAGVLNSTASNILKDAANTIENLISGASVAGGLIGGIKGLVVSDIAEKLAGGGQGSGSGAGSGIFHSGADGIFGFSGSASSIGSGSQILNLSASGGNSSGSGFLGAGVAGAAYSAASGESAAATSLNSILFMLKNNIQTATITLNPQSLGTVKIDVSLNNLNQAVSSSNLQSSGGVLTINMLAQNDAARNLLQSSSSSLQNSLKNQGFSTINLNISSGSSYSNSNGGGNGNESSSNVGSGAYSSGQVSGARSASASGSSSSPVSFYRNPQALVDYFV